MTGGQVTIPLVLRTANGAGLRFGAQHSQSIENWPMAIPGLKVVAPSSPADMKGLMAAAIRDDDPVIVCEHKALFAEKGDVPDGEHVVPLGNAALLREGSDVTLVALAAMIPRALAAADRLAADHGIDAEVIDLRSLIPLDAQAVLRSVAKTSRLFTIEENPRVGGWGAEIVSLVADEGFYSLDAPLVRITTPHIPLPSAAALEDLAVPSVDRIVETVTRRLDEAR
jgi:pyruvate dehydrogenase E1 component beta subunit